MTRSGTTTISESTGAANAPATQTEEFYILPENGKLFQYDCIAVNVIVNNREGGINSCDIPFTDDLKAFLHEYETLTEKVAAECKSTGKFLANLQNEINRLA